MEQIPVLGQTFAAITGMVPSRNLLDLIDNLPGMAELRGEIELFPVNFPARK